MKKWTFSIVLLPLQWVVLQGTQYPPPCDSPIYCLPGPKSLLHTVQMARVFKDSKTFVDMPSDFSEQAILDKFEEMMEETDDNPSRDRVAQFVNETFSKEGTEFEDWDPIDWKPDPDFLNNIQDDDYRAFAQVIHDRWKDLGRQIRSDIRNTESVSSLIYLEHPFIVPGGRFREMYYWDSYWTILGLLQSEMYDTVKGMLNNFVDLVQSIGHIPNGNRIYYTRRSQPPLFIGMVEEYYKVTQDRTFIEDNIEVLEAEFQFWMINRTEELVIDGKTYKVAVYNVEVDGPRPESYYEDYRDGQNFSSPEEQLDFYINIKSGAESGWDFGTKWFVDESGSRSESILDIHTSNISPVELNSYLCKNSRILKEFYSLLGNADKAEQYEQIRQDFIEVMDKVSWNDSLGSWFDFDLAFNKHRTDFYPSTVGPLWALCYNQTGSQEKVKRAITYLKDNSAFDYPGGVPTSLIRSNQQWDFPNGWPPLQELIVTGLENTGDPEAADLALELVKKWVLNNWVSFKQSNPEAIFEKYDVEQIGLPGGGGEYDVQEGFGWTNGVLLDFFSKYGDKISTNDQNSSPSLQPFFSISTLVAIILGWNLFRWVRNC